MSNLDRLFYWRGISDNFFNYKGQYTTVPLENRIKLLNAMGVNTSTESAIEEEVFKLDIKPWLNWLPPLLVTRAGSAGFDISLKPDELGLEFTWALSSGNAEIKRGSFLPHELEEVGDYHHQGKRFSRRRFTLGSVDPGYYQLSLSNTHSSELSELAAAPQTAYLPPWSRSEPKLWGFVIQLYTLRSASNWGIGDYADLSTLVRLSAPYGVDVIGLNPFHALQPNLDENYSPYSPSDRRFLNPLYIDVEKAPGFDADFRPDQDIDALRCLDHVNYKRLKELKYSVLYSCFENFLLGDIQSFVKYLETEGDELVKFANFEVANAWQNSQGVGVSIDRDNLLSALCDDQSVLPIEMRDGAFHCFLQWLAAKQVQECQDLAVSLGMKVGLLRDIAVGASGGGAEVQTNPELFCDEASIGAPPDPLALTGQNWGVPPMDPAEMRRSGFKHVRRLFQENMQSSGALRIDHAMSLYRLWWCPPGETADQGSYVYYPFEELMGILCLESHLNQTAVVAEDLGIVPDEFRSAMSERGLYGNKVFYFEKWQDTEFKWPSDYDAHALAMINNHDVPTLKSWWDETDLMLRDKLSLLEPGIELPEVVAVRRQEKQDVLNKTRESKALSESWLAKGPQDEMDWSLMCSIVNYAAQCKSQFFVIQLEDLLMMNDPVNVPGTFKEHQNWSRKLNKDIDSIFKDENISALLHSVNNTRKTS